MISQHIYLSVMLAHKESQMKAARQATRHSPGQAAKESTMSRNHPRPDQQRLGDLPAPGTAAMASPAPGGADLAPRRQLEKSVSWSGRERLRCLWYRLRLTVAEMNYATRRTVELRVPWISDNRASRSRNELR